MNLNIEIQNLRLESVILLKKGARLVKGGKAANPAMWKACEGINDRFLCYYWKHGGMVRYVGCTSRDYKGRKSNLLGRMSQYLSNHRDRATNKNVFEAVNRTLKTTEVEFGRFTFTGCMVDNVLHDYRRCSNAGDLTLMIEHLLIGFYKSLGQSEWNRSR